MADRKDDDDVPSVFCRTPEEFNNVLVRAMEESLARAEKEAAETGKTVEIGFGGVQEGPLPGERQEVLTMRWICEPGKPARRIA